MLQLKEELTLFDTTMIVIGAIIGSGIFLTPSLIARALPSPVWILSVWVLGGLVALSGALTFAELSSMMPHTGGVYMFLTLSYGPLVGFLYGWSFFLVVNTGAIAALSVTFSTYLGYFVPLTPTGIKIVAVTGIVVVTMINVLGVKISGLFSDVFTVLKLVAIIAIVILGIGWGTGMNLDFSDFGTGRLTELGSFVAPAMVGVLWSYGGWQHGTFAAAETRNAKRNLPIALILGSLVVMLIYVLTNVAYMFLLSPSQMGAASHVAADAVDVVLGPLGGSLIALAIVISTFGSANIYTLTAPRIYYAMAANGLFFRKVSEIHGRYHTPAFAILLQSAWAITLILFWGTFENLISYVVFINWIFLATTVSGIFLFRRRLPGAERPYRTVGYPITPLFFVAVSIWFVLNTLLSKPEQAIAGLILLALGLPVYYYWRNEHLHPRLKN